MGQQVFDVKYSLYIVLGFRIYRNTRIYILHNALQHVFEWGADIQIYNIRPGSHYLLSRFIAEADNSLQHVVFFRQFRLIRQLQGMRQFVNRRHIVE